MGGRREAKDDGVSSGQKPRQKSEEASTKADSREGEVLQSQEECGAQTQPVITFPYRERRC